MNEINQLILNTLIPLYGMTVLVPFVKEANSCLLIGLSWFVGWGIIGVMGITLVVFGIGVTPFKVMMMSLFFLATLIIYGSRHMQGLRLIHCYKKRFNKSASKKLFIYIGISAFIVYFMNFVYYTTDIIVSESLSRIFHDFGLYSNERRRLFYTLLNQRLPLYISIQSISRQVDVERYTSFSAVTTLFLCVGVVGFWRQQNGLFNKKSKFWLYAVIALLLSNNLIFTHVFTPLSNIITMGYYSMGVLCLCHYIKRKGTSFFILSCFLLGATPIIRKEMLFFALMPIVILGLYGLMPCLKIRLGGLLVYVLLAFSWYLWGISKVWSMKMVSTGFKTNSHGGYLIVLSLLPISIAFFLFPKNLWKSKIMKVTVTLLAAVSLLFLIFYHTEPMVRSLTRLFGLMLYKKGRWGVFWPIAIPAILAYMSSLFFIKKRSVYQTIKTEFYFGCDINFLAIVSISFIVARIVLYAIFASIKDDSFWSSGNRILMHVYPIIVYFLGRCGYAMEELCNKKLDN